MPNACNSPKPDKSIANLKVPHWYRWIFILIFCLMAHGATGQESALTDYVYPIDREEIQYTGPGIDWILDNVEDKQFLLFGEPHGVEDVPRLVEYFYDQLQPQGFKHLVLEIDATTAQVLAELPLSDFISRYPHNIAFDYDGELGLMQKVQSTYPDEQVIWGMDQMVNAIHAFQILEKVAKTPKTKRLCRGLHIKAALKGGRYISQENFEDLALLKKLFEQEENERALSIVSQIRTSMEIYVAYFAATRGEISYQFSSSKREKYMTQWFDDFVEKAREGEGLPKAIIKMGGAHTAYGIGPNGVLTLGDHVDKLASKAGGSILSLGLSYAAKDAVFPPKSLFEGNTAILIDYKAIRDQMDSASLATLPEALMNRLKYFDAGIYLNDPVRSAKSIISEKDNQFKERAIGRLVPYGLLVLLNLSLLFPLLKWLYLRLFKRQASRQYITYHVLLFALSLVLDLLLVAQILSVVMNAPVAMPTVMNPVTSFVIFMVLLLLCAAIFMLIRNARKKELWTRGMVRHYRLIAMGNVLLVLYMYYWNMGGMLG